MALLARHHGVAPDQWKSRNVVIKGCYATPIGLAVTPLATDAQLAIVPIVLAVTGNACGSKFIPVEITRVAGIAFDLRVRLSQGKLRRLVVIEKDRFPLVLVVTAVALGPISSVVDILNLVAIDARSADPLVTFAAVACRAGDDTVCTLKRKLGLIVIEHLHAMPRRFAVTVVARLSETPFMRIVRLVTIEAASGRVSKLYRWCVTAGALHGLVCVPELKIRKRVVERLAVELDDIGISPLMISVAMGAFLLRGIQLTPVKSSTLLAIRGGFFVACQTEACLRLAGKRLVTVAAVLFKLCMSADHRAGDDKLFEQGLRSHDRRYGACRNHADRKCAHESPAQWRTSTQKKCDAKT